MTKSRYMIKEASKIIRVEPHVLRYWEDELKLSIPRNDMGHRYYRKEDLEMFRGILLLKNKGFSLKAIQLLLPDLERVCQLDDLGLDILKEEVDARVQELELREQAAASVSTLPARQLMKQLTPVTEKESLHIPDQLDQIPSEEAPSAETADKKDCAADASTHTSLASMPAKKPVISEKEDLSVEECTETDSQTRLAQFTHIIGDIVNKVLEENNTRLVTEIKEDVTDNILKEVDYMLRVQQEQQDDQFNRLLNVLEGDSKSRRQIAAAGKKHHGWFRR